MLQQSFIDEMRQALLEQQKNLSAELAGQHVHSEMGDEEDENASEINVDEVSQEVIARVSADLDKIKVALVKIDKGTYGTDAEGNEISEARLRVLPWADKAI